MMRLKAVQPLRKRDLLIVVHIAIPWHLLTAFSKVSKNNKLNKLFKALRIQVVNSLGGHHHFPERLPLLALQHLVFVQIQQHEAKRGHAFRFAAELGLVHPKCRNL